VVAAEEPDRARGSAAQRWAVVAATVLLGSLLAAWALLTPAFRGADEGMHVSTTIRLAESGRYPEPGRAMVEPSIRAAYQWVEYFGREARTPVVARQVWQYDPPSMELLSAPTMPRRPPAVDQMTQHPPGYYLLLAGAYRQLDLHSTGPVVMLLALRALSLLLLLPLPWLCAVVARQVGLSPRAAAATAFLPASWMQFVDVSATVTNGTLLVLLSSIAIAVLVPVTQGDVRARRALGLGFVVALALLTKGFALALPPMVAVAYVLGARTAGWAPALRGMLVALLTTGLGLWWWVLNVVRHGELQPKGGVSFPAADAIPPLTQWVHDFSFTFMRTLWIAVGWNEGTPPVWLYTSATAVFALLLVAGSWALRGRRVVLLMHLAWLGPLAIVVSGSVGEFFYSGTTRAAQGRYVQTAVVAFAVLVAAALARFGRLLTWVPLVTMLSAIAGTAYGLHHFWAPAAGQHPWLGRLDTVGSWLPGGLATLGAVLAVAVLAGITGYLAVRAVPHVDPDVGDRPPSGAHSLVAAAR
jgi:4-amino-4-deoxy-L-arabinose transferase-like glycosyltransferase